LQLLLFSVLGLVDNRFKKHKVASWETLALTEEGVKVLFLVFPDVYRRDFLFFFL